MLMSENTIAIIQSVYKNDNAYYLKQAIDSILYQSYNNIMLYIGIDGPIGKDLNSVLSEYLNNAKIKILRYKENRGLASTLNDLLRELKTSDYQYIARMDADDISTPNRFEKQISFLEAHQNIDMIGGAINEIDEEGNDRGKVTKYPCNPDDCRKFFAKRNPVAHPTVMFRRSFFDKAGWRYPTDYVRNEDTRLWHEGYKHGCVIANIPDVVLNFRMTDSMFKNRRNGKAFAKSQLQLRKQIKKELGYGFMAYVYAYATFLLMISPSWILKLAYKFLR